MKVVFEQSKKFNVIVNNDVQHPLVVCSHERSGTHFLMNSIAANFPYVSQPWMDFDLVPLGSGLVFYNQGQVAQFLATMDAVTTDEGTHRLASIIKSHYASDFFTQSFTNGKLRFIYIYRNPVDTLISYWRFLHRWSWHEGKLTNTPLELISSAPEGYSMRFQTRTYTSVFDRWANHVLGWKQAAEKNSNIMLVQYEQLKNNFFEEMKKFSGFLELGPMHDEFRVPHREEYIKGSEITLSENDRSRFIDYINERIEDYPELKNLLSL